VARFLTNIAGPAGTLLVLDDLQWAGPDALDLLATLVHSVPDVPLRVLVAYRDAEASPNESLAALLADLADAGLARHHRLAPLTPEECEQLLQVVLDQSADIEHDLWQHVVRRTGGVPFFLLSCTQIATDSGYQQEALPWSVAQSVRQRVAALPEAAQEILGAAAVLGRDVRAALLLSMTTLPEHSVVMALETACRTRLLEEGENSYRFAHDIIREVVEADLGLARRRVLHLRAAAALEQDVGKPPVELLAYHYARSEAREQAAHYLEQAGDDDVARTAHAAAEGYYREAALRFDQLALNQDAARVAGKLGMVLESSGRWNEALAALEQAAGVYHESGQLEALGRVLGRIGYVHGKRGTVEEGIARLQPLVEQLRVHGELPGLAALYTALTVLSIQGGLYDDARMAGERAAELARRLGDERLQAVAEREYGSALMFLGCIEQGLEVLQEAARIAETAGDLVTLCGALGDLSAYYSNTGEFPRARTLIERVLALAEQLSDPYRITAALVNCVGIDILTGDWQQARQRCEQAITLHRQMSTSWEYPYALGCSGWLKLLEGAWDEAAQDLEQATAIAARSDDLQCLRCSQSLLAERDLLEGRPAVARARLIPLVDRPGMGEEWGVMWVLPILAWAHLELGEVNEAERCATQAIRRARAQGLRHSLVESLRVLAMIATRGGAWDAAERSLREGLSLSREIGYPYGEARLLLVYGELRTRTSLVEPARERLEAALAIFQRLGARKDVERTERLLAIALALEASPSM
ncbi:MAG TPA: hypothetical protein VN837_04485, partial [Chloroflexota bacterium]|nr:hypothetical protein [Chloroflexota bacterium]